MLRHFSSLLSTFDEDNKIVPNKKELLKSGIIFYESSDRPHTDSKGKTWVMTADDIVKLAENTNDLVGKSYIPVLIEHDKNINSVVGVIEHPTFEARPINNEDIEGKPKLKNLLGKMAVFCSNVKILDPKVIEKALYGIPLKVSAGIDMVNKVIKELSIVTLPALEQATLFNKYTADNYNDVANFTFSLEDKIAQRQEQQASREEVHKLVDDLMDVIESLQTADPELLAQEGIEDPNSAIMQNFETFEMMLSQLLGLEDDDQYEQDPQMMQQQAQQMQAPPQNPMMRGQYQAKYNSYDLPVTFAEAYSDVNSYNYYDQNAEFAFEDYRNKFNNGLNQARQRLPQWAPGYQAPPPPQQQPQQQPQKPGIFRRAGSLALKGAGLAAGAGALAAGVRYGRPVFNAARSGYKQVAGPGFGLNTKLDFAATNAAHTLKKGIQQDYQSAKGAIKSGFNSVRNRFKKPVPTN